MASEGGGNARSTVSFSFQKRSKAPRAVVVEDKDFVSSLEGNKINSSKPLPQAKEYIILTPKARRRNLGPDKSSEKMREEPKDGRTEEEMQLEREAAEAVLKDVHEAELRSQEEGEGEGPGHVISMLMTNRPAVDSADVMADAKQRPKQSRMEDYEEMPIGEFGKAMLRGMGWKKGEALGRTNKGIVEPIEFISRPQGLGLGATPRPKEPPKKPRIKKPGEETRKVQGPYIGEDDRVKHVKKIGEAIPDQPLKGFVVGNYAKVAVGPHEDLYGQITSVEEKSKHILLRMAINDQVLRFSQHHLELVSKEEYRLGRPLPQQQQEDQREGAGQDGRGQQAEKEYGLIVKKGRRDESKKKNSTAPPEPKRIKSDSSSQAPSNARSSSDTRTKTSSGHRGDTSNHDGGHRHGDSRRGDSRDGHHGSHRHGDRSQGRGDRQLSETVVVSMGGHDSQSERSSSSKMSRGDFWLSSNLRVKMVDRQYRKRYYNTKMTVVDVVSLGQCVCQAHDGTLLEGVTQDMLETVVPRQLPALVKVVRGRGKNQLATVVDQERAKAEAVIQLNLSKEVMNVTFDDICEYIGEAEET